MKILIISDIHANWHALEAVLARESHDALIFLGDAVDFGPDPKSCVDFLMRSSKARFWGVRGDHDPRASYAVIEDGEASIRRVGYDIEKTAKDLERSGMPCGVKTRLISMLVSASIVN